MDKVYVIHWYFYDHSGSGVMPYAYVDYGEAERALEMLNVHGSRQYKIEELKVLEAR